MPTTHTEAQPFETVGEKLKGRVAMVTGGTRGIGAAICHSLAAQGAAVAAGYGRDRERAEAFQAELSKDEIPVSIHQGNVGSAEDCRRTVQEVIDHHGRLDILVNNAGITVRQDDLQDDRRGLVQGPGRQPLGRLLHVPRGAGAHDRARYRAHHQHLVDHRPDRQHRPDELRRRRSPASSASPRRWPARPRSRSRRPTSSTSNEVGLTVNTVAPGFIETEMLDTVPEKVLDRIRGQVPLGRLGRPDEVARVVHFLAADAAGYITGQVWAVNGGQDM